MSQLDKLEKIKKLINNADPRGLLAGGAPDNEYDQEIVEIYHAVQDKKGKQQLIDVIDEIFYRNFNEHISKQQLENIAEKITEIK